MATVNKNFKVKNGLVVETTATVGGNTVLTENASDQYILNLIGGETLVKSVTGNLSVDGSGVLSLDQNSLAGEMAGDYVFTSGDNLNVDIEGIATDLTGSYGFATTTNVSDAINTEVTNRNDAIATAKSEAGVVAQGYADDAETAANSYTDTAITNLNLGTTYDAYGAASTAESNANIYTDNKINDASNATDKVWSAYKTSTEIGIAQQAAEDHADQAVADLVNGAPALLDTLNELAAALQDNPDVITDLQDIAAGKQDTLTAGSNIDIAGSTISVTGLDAADISDFNSAALSATSAAYDAAGSASAAQTAAASDATSKANAAQAAAEATASADATSKANAAEAAAIAHADALDTDDIEEGATNLYFTNARAISAVGGTIGDAINDLTTSDIEEGSNLYFTNQRAIDAGDGVFDGFGAAAAADTSARGYADSLASNYDPAGAADSAASAAYSDAVAAAATDASTKATNALNDAKSYTDQEISGEVTDRNNAIDQAINTEVTARNSAITTAISTEVTDRNNAIATAKGEANDYTDTAVSNLVGAAPEMLDTLQELASALQDNPDIISDLESVAAGKQDALTPGSNIDITNDVISVVGLNSEDISDFSSAAVTANTGLWDTVGAAADAQSAAETTAATYTDGQIENLTTGGNGFTLLNINDESAQFAASSTSLGSVAVTAYEWAKSDYRAAKVIVKIDNGTDNEVSEILLTLDSSDNVAITEYAIVGTNGSRGTITADVSGSNVRIRVNPVNDSTIKVTGTLLK
jgi:hypothetical protein